MAEGRAPGGGLLVVRNDRLGDAVLALPAVSVLRRRFPDHRLYFWAAPAIAPLIELVSVVDGVIAGDDKGRSDITDDLKRSNIETAFCLRATAANAKALVKAGIPRRYGTSRRWYSYRFNRRVNLSRRGSNLHEADLNLKLLEAAGITGEPNFPPLEIPTAASNKIGELLGNAPAYVVIHPGSGGSAADWPIEYFLHLADSIRARGYRVVITGVAGEEDKCAGVAGDNHLNLCGATSIVELAALISGCDLFVSNSTGPLHLAVALGKRSLGLYPPLQDCLPQRWGPYRHPDWALTPDLPLCRRCHPGEFSPCACMERLLPDNAISKALAMLDG